MDIDEYEDIEAWLLMAVGQFESRWEKAWKAWIRTHDIPEDEAADMCNGSPYDDGGNIIPEIEEWYGIYNIMKNAVEEEFGVDIIVDIDGTAFARHTLPGGDMVTVP